MSIYMAGIDHEHADIQLRERLSFVAGQVAAVLGRARAYKGVRGCVLISTCNRTELYLSADSLLDAAAVLCACAGVEHALFADAIECRADDAAVRHLFKVACGLRSQILGEDQIVTQVKQAATLARDAHQSDAVLETLFRCAVTAGKEVKTELRLTAVPLSAAHQAVALAEQLLCGLSGKRVVVIGNGEMGRLTCELLVARGAAVTVTLRTYRHGETIVPRGCKTQPYDARMAAVEGCALVVSATTSPHYTLTAEQIAALDEKPQLIIDLALPRDVEPAAGALTCLRNMDDLGRAEDENAVDFAQVEQIMQKQRQRFYEWLEYRASLPLIESVKETLFVRVWSGEGDEDVIRAAVDKTVDLLLGGMKEAVTPQLLEKTLGKLQKSAVPTEKLRGLV